MTPARSWAELLFSSRRSATLLIVLIAVVYGSGFINLLPTGHLYAATLLIDCITIVLGILVVLGLTWDRRVPELWVWGLAGLALVYVALSFHGGENVVARLTTVRSSVLYAVVGVFAATRLSVTDARRVIRVLLAIGVVFAAFGLLQFALRNALPEWLLVSRDTNAFSYYGTDIIRSTGLLGNTIIYANLMLLYVAVFAFRLMAKFSWGTLVSVILAFAAVVVTFSRLAIVGAVLISLVAFVLWLVKNWSRRMGIVLAVVGGVVVVVLGVLSLLPGPRQVLGKSFLVEGLILGGNASVQGSTDIHSSFANLAWALLGGPDRWFGLGLGTQTQGSVYSLHHAVVTDGAALATLLEGGLVLVVAYAVVIACCAVYLVRARLQVAVSDRYFVVALFVYGLFLVGVSSFVNSAYFGKVLFITLWLMFGLAMALRQGRATVDGAETDGANRSASGRMESTISA